MTGVKLCGMTRPEDVVSARALGVDYVGCVFVGGPRQRTAAQAATLWHALGAEKRPRRAGVFASHDLAAVAEMAATAALDIVQLQDAPSPDAIARLRAHFAGEVWAVVRCVEGRLPPRAEPLWLSADALVLDTHVPGVLGGTGVPLPWAALAPEIERVRGRVGAARRLVLAGGLTADNVARAIALLQPDVVDVSSGVERAPARDPGVKDPARMRAFVDAVAGAHPAAPTPSSTSPPPRSL